MNLKGHLVAIAFAASMLIAVLPGRLAAQVNCPLNRPPGYWAGPSMCSGTNVVMPDGSICHMIICYCWHPGTPGNPTDPEEYFVMQAREAVPGCSSQFNPIDVMKAIRKALINISCVGGDPHHPTGCTGVKAMRFSHPMCFRYEPVIGGEIMRGFRQGCDNSGECIYDYLIYCSTCEIISTTQSSTGQCSYADGCYDICY